MAKTTTQFVCRECGGVSAKWAGQCSDCSAWNTLEEQTSVRPQKSDSRKGRFAGLPAANPNVQALDTVVTEKTPRLNSTISELDRVLGGGFVPGSVVLIGGDPGIGKSTLLLQALVNMHPVHRALYVTGEESVHQIASRAQRLGLGKSDLSLATDNCLESIMATALSERPDVMVVDSVQTLFTETLQSAPGSVVQVRETASQLVRLAKTTGIVVILVGHVTKEGALAGPRVLEHMVDAVLYFEGDRGSSFRLVRAIKNRFGAVNEIGVFAMTDQGLREVSNPSAMFVTRRQDPAPGSVILATLEGSRPLLVEVQALVDRSGLANPRRLSVGFEQNRLAMLLAVLRQHCGLALHDHDVFVNVVGGIRTNEPAADLAIVLAVASSFRGWTLSSTTCVFGEVGLTGEIRPVQRGQERIKEATKLGFDRVLLPASNLPRRSRDSDGLKLHGLERLGQAVSLLDEAMEQEQAAAVPEVETVQLS